MAAQSNNDNGDGDGDGDDDGDGDSNGDGSNTIIQSVDDVLVPIVINDTSAALERNMLENSNELFGVDETAARIFLSSVNLCVEDADEEAGDVLCSLTSLSTDGSGSDVLRANTRSYPSRHKSIDSSNSVHGFSLREVARPASLTTLSVPDASAENCDSSVNEQNESGNQSALVISSGADAPFLLSERLCVEARRFLSSIQLEPDVDGHVYHGNKRKLRSHHNRPLSKQGKIDVNGRQYAAAGMNGDIASGKRAIIAESLAAPVITPAVEMVQDLRLLPPNVLKSSRIAYVPTHGGLPFYISSMLSYHPHQKVLAPTSSLVSVAGGAVRTINSITLPQQYDSFSISAQQLMLKAYYTLDALETIKNNSVETSNRNEGGLGRNTHRRRMNKKGRRRRPDSYHFLLGRHVDGRQRMRPSPSRENDNELEAVCDVSYDPCTLDDPELRSGKHRTVMKLPSLMISVFHYVKSSDLKRALNEQFREKYPDIDITLSKLRSLKREMLDLGFRVCEYELSTVAYSYVYFEKLVLNGLINKANRKVLAVLSLLMAIKFNDPRGANTLGVFYSAAEEIFRVSKNDILSHEFSVFVALNFSLHVDMDETLPHLEFILAIMPDYDEPLFNIKTVRRSAIFSS